MDHTHWNFGGSREHDLDHGGRSFASNDAPTCSDKRALFPTARSCGFEAVATGLLRLRIAPGLIDPTNAPSGWAKDAL